MLTMPRTGKKLRAVVILLIILAVLLLSAFSAAASAKATPVPPAQTCAINGRVVDTQGNGIGGAKITLYNMTIIDGKTFDTGLTTVDRNPQYTSGGDSANAGSYQFTGVPVGTYDIMVDVNGMRYPEIVHATGGTLTTDFVISPSGNQPRISTTPVPTSTTGPTEDPIVTVIPAGPTPGEKQGNDDPVILRVTFGILVALHFIAACIVVWLVLSRRV